MQELQEKKYKINYLLMWGALPATIILRNNDKTLNKETKNRYHQKLRLLTNVDIPTKERELEDPLEAIQKFNSCIDYLRQRTRDKAKYSLIFNENVSYGQARNLLGLKTFGLTICSILIAIQLFSIYKNYGVGLNISAVPIFEIISVIITVLFLSFWIFFVSAKQVYNAGVNYSKALLESSEHIE
ncbi:ComEC/Rec2 family competence protein [Bacillus sp. 522_BSPC]